MKTILVVCHGNIFRSPVAQSLVNKELEKLGLSKTIKCVSRGIQGQSCISPPKFNQFRLYKSEFELAESVLQEYGIDINEHESKPIDFEIVNEAEYIIALDKDVVSGEGRLCNFGQDIINKTIVFEIPDPINEEGLNKYRLIINELQTVVLEAIPLINRLVSEERSEIDQSFKQWNSKEF